VSILPNIHAIIFHLISSPSTVWIYLFFLPFQLVAQFGYSTIPGVAIAAFIYLGFLAAGEEIEQPFGYDDVGSGGCVSCLDS
jgi:predicted membrane chloride channel (bestrophin family)